MPNAVVRRIVLCETSLPEERRAKPMPAWMITLSCRDGELEKAVTARSARSNVDQETEPDELALNWTPAHGNGEAVLFAPNVMGFPDVPSARSVPSTNRCMSGSNLTVVPGRIVSVAGTPTVTSRMTTYVVSLSPHTVSVVMRPRTYVVAATEGARSKRAPHAAARRTRTSAMLRRAEGGSWGRMRAMAPGPKRPAERVPVSADDILSR